MTLEDAADIYEYGADPEMTRFTSWETHRSVDDARGFLQRAVSWFRRRWSAHRIGHLRRRDAPSTPEGAQ
jgi:hypothetical protein